ncbi:MAG: HNH endonuclease [Deltaproteobacteria bacterium]|nr:HNH endonuclease [Deltaproteobacteria bacterium]
MRNSKWTREELILAFNLYCKISFGSIHNRNPQIIELAKAIDRTPSAVSWKLANFARLDPSLKKRNIKGASHGSKGEEEIWEEFNDNWEKLAFESERFLAGAFHKPIEQVTDIKTDDLPREGKERETIVRARVNQQFFRKAVLSAYDFKCCITGLPVVDLLNASHIVPWSVDEKNRVNPRNGLCLNVLHDRAFDRGLMTITAEFEIRLSKVLLHDKSDKATRDFFLDYKGQKMNLPNRFVPDATFLKHHNDHIFIN